jgi:hypothetical protein
MQQSRKSATLQGSVGDAQGHAAPRTTAAPPTRYAQEPVSTHPAFAEVQLAVLSVNASGSDDGRVWFFGP